MVNASISGGTSVYFHACIAANYVSFRGPNRVGCFHKRFLVSQAASQEMAETDRQSTLRMSMNDWSSTQTAIFRNMSSVVSIWSQYSRISPGSGTNCKNHHG